MEILDQINLDIKPEQVMERLHLGNDDKYIGIVQELMDEVMPIIRPKAMYDTKFVEHIDKDKVDIGGVQFTSRVLRVNLDKIGRVFPYVVTSGIEAEKIIAPDSDLMGKFILDAIKEMALEVASNHLYKYIKNKYKIEKMSTMNPGSLEDWPISEQKPLFSLFGEVEKLIGVRLSDSFLMFPIKSVSGIYFPTESSFASCQLCSREKCPNRRAKYDPELKEKYMS
ncbi:TPA: vitamin B12 dependent methionine synthase [bacterium]|nr:vitamin B12 dependent methionine synthase [bacterium]